jgi:hypothetical protein
VWTRSPRSSSSHGGRAILLTATWAALTVPPAAAKGTHAPHVRPAVALAREILADKRYQTQLPVHVPDKTWSFNLPGVPDWLLRGMVIVIVGVLLALLLDRVRRARRERDGAVDETDEVSPTMRRGIATLADAERLAAAGHYVEAVHLLLLAAIESLGHEAAATRRPAATSREILDSLGAVSPTRREAFSELVRQVEISLFGGRDLGAGEFARCLDCCRTIVEARA